MRKGSVDGVLIWTGMGAAWLVGLWCVVVAEEDEAEALAILRVLIGDEIGAFILSW